MDKIRIESTSLRTAKASEIILSESDNVKLSFQANLIENSKRPDDSVNGKIVYQKKHKSDQFIDYEKLSRANMKVSDWMEVSLSTTEVAALFNGLKCMYEVFQSYGIQYGQQAYVPLDGDQIKALEILSGNEELLSNLLESQDDKLLNRIFKLVTTEQYSKKFSTLLSQIEINGVENLNVAVNLESLKRTSSIMSANLDNGKEEFWQSLFEDNPWILTQLFHTSVSILECKAFVGGKRIDNAGGTLQISYLRMT